ncbi:DUF3126 family protein [Henriciella mobilis]|uniref:DUF3126 family protein n=1 Tax=Henriciella mobilis TaxID=2305467 RepID=A0A399R5J7_9PROT|nr:DUF3126 family protein [Henriciella mobilis]RIJ14957.1 DUF3126 family protein [Henriciella mobilis]RIJ21912.1 DUF3126 family protein [Henriciella mobilis]RIJ26588.1 DUF3126 family protein [Henriciella mobilis]
MEKEETLRLEAYLKEKLNPGIRLVSRSQTDDSVEVYLGAEFIAVVYKDVDEGEVAYQFQMTVLSEDIRG